MSYLLLKWIHILAAIAAAGANITYGIWIARASRQPDVLPFTLRGIKIIDDFVANPAYGLLLVTGLAMALVGGLPLTTPWLAVSLALYVLLVGFGLFGYTPTLSRQLRLLDTDGAHSPAYLALARRGQQLGIVIAILVMAIIYLMVLKPTLWA